MIVRPVHRDVITDHEVDLWVAFLDAYTSTGTRGAVDVFLKGLMGVPRG